MPKRPASTILFLGTHRTDRVDFDAAPDFEVISSSHQAGNGSDDVVTRVETSLAFAAKLGKVVWILWEGAGAGFLKCRRQSSRDWTRATGRLPQL